MVKNRFKHAFSLIELSIVILVIGILIAGIISGSRLYSKFKIQTARQITQSSAVSGIKDLAFWLETTMPESFIANEINSNSPIISTWNDISPQNLIKLKATQNTSANQPQYVENIVNGLPVVRFGTSFLSSNFPFEMSIGKTLFIVLSDNDADGGLVLYCGGNRYWLNVASSGTATTYSVTIGGGTVISASLYANPSNKIFIMTDSFT